MVPPYRASLVQQSFPTLADKPDALAWQQSKQGFFDLKNTGSKHWIAGQTILASIPRDQASPLASSKWLSSSRAATVTKNVAPGAVGRFYVTLLGNKTGLVTQSFGLLHEQVTWFADAPLGGGPADGAIATHVKVAAPPPDCAASCAGKVCGPDGCGGSCGNCSSDDVCSLQGACECRPTCTVWTCGWPDGCGAYCRPCVDIDAPPVDVDKPGRFLPAVVLSMAGSNSGDLDALSGDGLGSASARSAVAAGPRAGCTTNRSSGPAAPSTLWLCTLALFGLWLRRRRDDHAG